MKERVRRAIALITMMTIVFTSAISTITGVDDVEQDTVLPCWEDDVEENSRRT